MRLKQSSLLQVGVFKPKQEYNGYVGTSTVYQFAFTLKANVQPLESRLQAEIYGERINEMLTLLIEKPCDLLKGYCISVAGDKPTHKVISVKEYCGHIQAIVEIYHE